MDRSTEHWKIIWRWAGEHKLRSEGEEKEEEGEGEEIKKKRNMLKQIRKYLFHITYFEFG